METLDNLWYAIESYGCQRQRIGLGKGGHYAPSTMEMFEEDLWQSRDVLNAELAAVEGLILTAEEALGYADATIAGLQAEVTDYKAKAKHYAKRTTILAEALADAGGKVMAYSNDPQLVRMVNDILLRATGAKQ